MSLFRVAVRCEMRDCERLADYFWHVGEYGTSTSTLNWLPICAQHATDLSEDLRGDMKIAVLGETSAPAYLGTRDGALRR
jgi:hypothetical protein